MREGKFMKVSTLLAERFETVEALAVIDILRRAKIEVDTVSFSGERNVTSAQGVTVVADALIEDYDFSDTDVLFLPGGPGHKNYKASSQVLDLITSFARSGKWHLYVRHLVFRVNLDFLKVRKRYVFQDLMIPLREHRSCMHQSESSQMVI